MISDALHNLFSITKPSKARYLRCRTHNVLGDTLERESHEVVCHDCKLLCARPEISRTGNGGDESKPYHDKLGKYSTHRQLVERKAASRGDKGMKREHLLTAVMWSFVY